MLSVRARFFPLVGACLALGLLSGCGPGLGTPQTVKGKVTVDGQPAADHMVTFNNTMGDVPAEHRSFQAKTSASGEYELQKVFPGEYDVMITAPLGDSEKAVADPGTLIPESGGTTLKAKVGGEPLTFDCPMKKAT